MSRRIPRLPEGYRIMEDEGVLSLRDPQGRVLMSRPAGREGLEALEAHAWDDAWTDIEHEVRAALRDVREGRRVLAQTPRARQYLRLVGAVSPSPPARERVAWVRTLLGLIVLMAAALLVGRSIVGRSLAGRRRG